MTSIELNILLNLIGAIGIIFVSLHVLHIKRQREKAYKKLLKRLDDLIILDEKFLKKENQMLYKGRSVVYIRDANKTDPYWDGEYKQVIVEYLDGEGRETVKEDELKGWDAEKRRGLITDEEKAQARIRDDARKNADKTAYTPADQNPDMKVQIVDPKKADKPSFKKA